MSNGLRASFAAIFILSYHSFVVHLFGNADGDLEICHMLVERFLKLYPDVSCLWERERIGLKFCCFILKN